MWFKKEKKSNVTLKGDVCVCIGTVVVVLENADKPSRKEWPETLENSGSRMSLSFSLDIDDEQAPAHGFPGPFCRMRANRTTA